jgi:ABC-type transport system substrate-binding protein
MKLFSASRRSAFASARTALLTSCALLAPVWSSATTEPKILVYPRIVQFESLDPVAQFDEESRVIVSQVYSTLLSYAYLERPYTLAPDLLTRMPEASADKLTYTFTLRPGVLFHDDPCFPGGKGRELTSDDVLYSLKRFADARLNNKSWFALEGDIVGLDAYRAATAKAAPGTPPAAAGIAGFTKIDAHRFSLRLTHENPLFLFAFALSSSSIVPHEAVEKYKDQFSVHPVGTGPFTLHQVDRKGVLHFLRNPHYHGVYPSVGAPGDAAQGLLADAGKQLPLLDGIDMPLIEEAQPAALMFLKGELDWRGLDRANFSKLVRRNPDGSFRLADEVASKFNIYSSLGLNSTYYAINLKDPVLGHNKLLRQALARLVDTGTEIEVLYNGRGRPLQSLVPIDIPGGQGDTGATGNGYHLAKAKQLLAAAGYPGGQGLPPLTLSMGDASVATHNLFDLLKARFAAAGVQLKPDLSDYPRFLKNLSSGNFQIADTGWNADYPDAEDFYQLLYSKNVAPGPNSPSFANAAYDRAYEASRYLPNGPKRYAYFKTMNDIIQDEAPVILGLDPLRFGITQKWLRNFKRNTLATEFQYLDIDMALKKQGLK